MRARTTFTLAAMAVAILSASGCSRLGITGSRPPQNNDNFPTENRTQQGNEVVFDRERSTIWDLFSAGNDPNITVEVNKYIWAAALDVLDFMPIQAADPFSGVIVYGFGTPPGSNRAYRATVYVQDPALDARSLRVALATRSGPAPAETVRAVEDAILTRARQLRIRDGDL
ncbi:DUF3576 domain-containing protein [Ovoidimarina sediminis]|uniref:DUF3576 domain-containing protein n=1 Tax=Ovoidimarina sediminis TaxID=3079856 RepID=UPI002907D82C|nr:DUF3576 domain-containing protein [Rhodophyticola sp. MJ-SS7]MDU8943784.1 DUF3576 domain-containing protein [Rhodophyticola sp. MJ-SS7]